MMTELSELESLAWKLLIRDAARAERESGHLCFEEKRLLKYFVRHGAPRLSLNADGDFYLRRASPYETPSGESLKRLLYAVGRPSQARAKKAAAAWAR
jgi:hypothetical protein